MQRREKPTSQKDSGGNNTIIEDHDESSFSSAEQSMIESNQDSGDEI